MRRRQLLAAGCAHGAALWGGTAFAAEDGSVAAPVPAFDDDYAMPQRFQRPDVASDEGGLWALMDGQEAKLRRSSFMMHDAALHDYLQGIACRLAGEHAPDVRVYPMRTPFFNASMAPNGMMQVWSGLLLRVDNEAQLAAVLGHETGHYLQRHAVERLRDAKQRSAFGLFMAPLGIIGLGAALANRAGGMGYSRDQEREADRIGLLLMRRAGYDPREASRVWTNLLDELSAGPGDPAKRSPMFASHPASQERADTLGRLAAQMPPGGEVGDAEFVRQMAPLQALLIEDEILRGQYGESLVLFTRLIGRSPTRADLFAARGEVHRLRGEAGDADAALADLEHATALGGEPPSAWRSLGYLRQKRQQSPEARVAFARYVELAPDAPDVDMIKTYLSDQP